MKTSMIITVIAALAFSPALAKPDFNGYEVKEGVRVRGVSKALNAADLFRRFDCNMLGCDEDEDCKEVSECSSMTCQHAHWLIGRKRCQE